jgi:hypothetical protein
LRHGTSDLWLNGSSIRQSHRARLPGPD